MHKFLLHNASIKDSATGDLRAGQVGLLSGWGVFSTIRICEGVLFEFERHWERMQTDAAILHVPFPSDAAAAHSSLRQLAEANQAHNATMRVVVVRNRGGLWEAPNLERDFDIIAFTADLNHWGDSVSLGIKAHARHAQSEFAGLKILSWAQNLTWYEEAHQKGFDEFMLLNERGEVSECTSANLFMVTGNDVLTPPLVSGCLPGVTRALLLEEIRIPGVTVREKTLAPEDFEAADRVFISSTTRDLLPVRHIEGLRLRTPAGSVMESLQSAFAGHRERYCEQRRALAGKA